METTDTLPVYFIFPGNLDTPTGGYHYDRRLIGELREAGMKVNTLSLPDCFPYPDRQALEVTRQILSSVPNDAVVIMDGLAFGVLDDLAAAEAARLRMIALCHHPLALESGLEARQRQAFMVSERKALQHVRGVVVTSAHTGRILTTEFGIADELIAVALPGTDPVPFAPGNGNPPRLLTVASLIRRKAHDLLIDSLARLRDLPWTARFVGDSKFDPDWADSMQQRVVASRLQDRICFVGPLDELADEYQNADIFVLPSRYEGYGMVYAEALAAGLPVIAASTGAVPEVVPSSAGLLVPGDDTNALTVALTELLTDADKRRQLQTGARRAAAQLPSWTDCARCVIRKIEEVRTS